MTTRSSKRSLYHPAAESKAGVAKNRRCLAQGRLVTGNQNQPLSTRLEQGIGVSRQNEYPHTPRKQVPRETETRSPRPGIPQDSLDLSDPDVTFPLKNKENVSVMVFDASRHMSPLNKAEVDVVMGYERSPAKVVCHSKAAVQRHVRDCGTDQDHRQVVVDQVPHISLSPNQLSNHPVISPRVIREKPLKGGQVDPPTSVSRVIFTEPTSGNRITPVRPTVPHYPQPNFDSSQESDGSAPPQVPLTKADDNRLSDSDIHSVISDSDACSLHEYVSSSKKSGKSQQPSQTPAKKRGKIIPSRYMRAAHDSKLMSSERSFAVNKSSHGSMEAPTSAKKRRARIGSARHVTPVANQVSAKKKTSTPTHEVPSMLCDDIDASAIQAEISVVSLDNISNIKPDKKPHQSMNMHKSDDVTQDMLDVIHARYLQWVFVEAKARSAADSREKEAIAQLSGLWEMNEKMAAREAELRVELARQRHQNILDDQLEIQEGGLCPVVGPLTRMEIQYKSLADNLDTTRHQILTSGIYIPQDEGQFEDKLEQALQESEQLLGELSVMTRQEVPHIKEFATDLSAGRSTLLAQKQHIHGCKEILEACQSLTIQENSLKIQDLQMNK